MSDTTKCTKCHKDAEYQYTFTNKNGKKDIYICPDGHETEVPVKK